jgi:hypothetical protein
LNPRVIMGLYDLLQTCHINVWGNIRSVPVASHKADQYPSSNTCQNYLSCWPSRIVAADMTHTVLIAEDEALVAAFLEDIVVQAGLVPLGPCRSRESVVEVARSRDPTLP